MKNSVGSQVKAGFYRAGAVLATFFTVGLLFAGFEILFGPDRGKFPTGIALVVVASVLMILTISRWVKFLPAILGTGAFAGLVATATGHLPNHPDAPINWIPALGFSVLLMAGCALSITFSDRPLTVLDRVALLALALSIALGVGHESSQISEGHARPDLTFTFIALAIGLLCLALAWVVDKLAHSRTSTGTRLAPGSHD